MALSARQFGAHIGQLVKRADGHGVTSWVNDYLHHAKQLYNPENYGVDVRLPGGRDLAREMAIATTVGGGLGAMRGLISPGFIERTDAHGNVVAKKRRGRLSAAVQNGLFGAGSGAAGAYASQTLSQYNPEIDKLLDNVATRAQNFLPVGATKVHEGVDLNPGLFARIKTTA
jgi:hypothetical protein